MKTTMILLLLSITITLNAQYFQKFNNVWPDGVGNKPVLVKYDQGYYAELKNDWLPSPYLLSESIEYYDTNMVQTMVVFEYNNVSEAQLDSMINHNYIHISGDNYIVKEADYKVNIKWNYYGSILYEIWTPYKP